LLFSLLPRLFDSAQGCCFLHKPLFPPLPPLYPLPRTPPLNSPLSRRAPRFVPDIHITLIALCVRPSVPEELWRPRRPLPFADFPLFTPTLMSRNVHVPLSGSAAVPTRSFKMPLGLTSLTPLVFIFPDPLAPSSPALISAPPVTPRGCSPLQSCPQPTFPPHPPQLNAPHTIVTLFGGLTPLPVLLPARLNNVLSPQVVLRMSPLSLLFLSSHSNYPIPLAASDAPFFFFVILLGRDLAMSQSPPLC